MKMSKYSQSAGSLPSHESFWQSKTFEEIALMQGVQPIKNFDALLGGWPEDEVNDNFEETVIRWRHENTLQHDE
ncbi:hypothetical protein PN36_30205 [Candidatus Thiomargarita nelsonii]|uniref:Uncharacterized protein n=1 Tax=Candidatus Thiomargarita nelsonii TaxID=1003181 RepID=A0A0A6P3I2_9GAMM|nr:hypothetical protein PN36_30205 [Candidatus Thiomargarita nelsonii]